MAGTMVVGNIPQTQVPVVGPAAIPAPTAPPAAAAQAARQGAPPGGLRGQRTTLGMASPLSVPGGISGVNGPAGVSGLAAQVTNHKPPHEVHQTLRIENADQVVAAAQQQLAAQKQAAQAADDDEGTTTQPEFRVPHKHIPQTAHKTVVGMAPISMAVPPSVHQDPPGQATVVGLPPVPGVGLAPQQARSNTQNHSSSNEPKPQPGPPKGTMVSVGQAQPRAGSRDKKTLLGLSSPDMGNVQIKAPEGPKPPEKRGRRYHQTVMGIAIPGIAPTKITDKQNEAPESGISFPSPPTQVSAGIKPGKKQVVEEYYDEIVAEPGVIRKRKKVPVKSPPFYRRGAFYLLVAAATMAITATVVLVMSRSPLPLSAKPILDSNGKEALELACEKCADGTSVWMASGSHVKFKGRKALLPLTIPLKVGDNPITILLQRGAGKTTESYPMVVPVAYLIRPDVGGLQQSPPKIWVVIEALKDSFVTVQGKKVVLDAQGKARHEIDVSDLLTGVSTKLQRLEREISYTVAPPGGGAPETGKITVNVGIVSLKLSSPGLTTVTEGETFMLAGKTNKGAGISVGGGQVSVGSDGSFAQMMKISDVGQTKVMVRADSPPLAPRVVEIAVKRVKSLDEEAKSLEILRKFPYSKIAAREEISEPVPIAWSVEVQKAANTFHQTLAVVDVKTGCLKSPCIARLTIPGDVQWATGEKLRVYGDITGMGAYETGKIPEVTATFVLKEK
jgi:hypothetical protein